MVTHSLEQTTHDRLNLARLVRRLEKSTQNGKWNENGEVRYDSWIQAQGMLQKVKYAKRLLKDVTLQDSETSIESVQHYQRIQTSLQQIELFLQGLGLKTPPNPTRATPLLSQITPPAAPSIDETSHPIDSDAASAPQEASLLLPAEGSPQTNDLSRANLEPLLDSSQNHFSTLLPPLRPPESVEGSERRVLGSSTAVQAELASQLASMATQLKRNAMHFSDSLGKDEAVLSGAQEKLERNFDVMKAERTKLRDHRGKSRWTTCLVTTSVVVVLMTFVLMLFVIRLT